MSRQKSRKSEPLVTTPEQREMRDIRAVPRSGRSQEQIDRLQELVRQERVERFKRMAGPRLNKALKAIDQLAALANVNSYVCEEEDRAFILNNVDESHQRLIEAFQPRGTNGAQLDTFPWQRRQ